MGRREQWCGGGDSGGKEGGEGNSDGEEGTVTGRRGQ